MSLLQFKRLKIDVLADLRAKMDFWLWQRDMGGIASWRRPRVYGICYPQLGDHWVGLCHLVRFRRLTGIPHVLSLPEEYGRSSDQRIALAKEIAGLLRCGSELEFSVRPAELSLPVHPARNGRTIVLSDARSAERNLLAYQFDGISHRELNPSPEEEASFLDCFAGTPRQKIGRPLSLAESMAALLHARLFIGVSSGMSHVAASAGTPTLIYVKHPLTAQPGVETYAHLRRWNPYPETHFFSSLSELKDILARKFRFLQLESSKVLQP